MDSPNKTELDDLFGDSADLGRPLCVALHGALIRTDIWWEHLIAILRKQPYLVFLLPLWVLGGRARLERAVEARSSFDVATLPYRAELLAALRAAQQKGRRIVLFAPGEARLAERVAEQLGVFAEVVADDAATSAEQQSARLTERFGKFDFVGHAASEQPLLAAAEKSFLISAGALAVSRARGLGPKLKVLSKRPSVLRASIKVLRVHQWSKNALVVVPLLLAPNVRSFHQVLSALLAALSFSLCASSGYVFNDLIDIEADRAHHTKHRRPFASGALPAALGPLIFFGLFGLSFAIALSTLPLPFTGMLAAYFVATMSYSLVLKSKLMLDVVVLAGLYTHRVLSGGIATGIQISTWLLAFSLFMFSSLAFAKRFIELQHSAAKGGQLKSRGYFTEDLAMVASMGPTAGYIAVLLFCLYIQESNAARAVYRTPALLWFLVPVLLYWISRVWFLANRGQMQDDPVKFALTDRRSWACGAIAGIVAVAARLWH
jgi:4-hydroxybenzoate polyprenyltransferase